MKTNLILTFLFILLLGCADGSNKGSFVEKNRKNIFVRNAHSMAYHSKDSKIYIFGGANEKEVLSDLCVLDSTNWLKVYTKIAPQPRTFAPLIYDSENNRLLLFGGSKVLFGNAPDPQNLLNDTWQFKNNQWEEIITSNAPSPRAEAVMVYDESRKTTVLFGGYNIQNGEYLKLKDTWEFYDNNWRLISTEGPSERHGVAMAYDSENKSVVLFGGSTIDKQYGEFRGETWKWNGNEWSKLKIEQPTGVFNASMTYNKEQEELIRFGGWNGKARINETWSFNENNWNKLTTTKSPSPRNHSSIVYDEKNKRIVLFGGHDGENLFGDIWEFKNNNWNKILESKPIKRIENNH